MNFLSYLWTSKNSRWQILLTAAIVLGFVMAVLCSSFSAMSFFDMWQNWMEAFLAFSAIIIGVFIWHNEKKQDWEYSLPKKLDVFFYFEDKVFYEIRNAPLTGSDDVRQWGQQIGRQMNDDVNLSFDGFNVKGPMRDTDKNGDYIMRYVLTVWLQEIDHGKEAKVWQYDDDGKVLKINLNEAV